MGRTKEYLLVNSVTEEVFSLSEITQNEIRTAESGRYQLIEVGVNPKLVYAWDESKQEYAWEPVGKFEDEVIPDAKFVDNTDADDTKEIFDAYKDLEE